MASEVYEPSIRRQEPLMSAGLAGALDGEEFLESFRRLSEFGAVVDGGVDREAATRADGEQRAWFSALLQRHGFRVARDPVGNLFGLYEFSPGAPWVLTGSHLDSQPTAGRFDGAYGVLASAFACFRVVERLRADGIKPALNIAVVDWFNEEGSRFKPSMMGSAVFTGKMTRDTALATRDRAGESVASALDELNERGDFEGMDVRSYAEIHVQQGRSMENEGITIGLVNATWAARKFELEVIGEQAHVGSAAMVDRRDALLGAAKLVVAARELAESYPEGRLHASVGELDVYPNSAVTLASRATVLFDMRSPDVEVIDDAERRLTDIRAEIERTARVQIRQVSEHRWDLNAYQSEGVDLARDVAEGLGLRVAEVMTVAGHDSTNMKDITPSVMLFVPSVDGVSHNVKEFTRDTDLVAGLDVLEGVVARLADGALLAK
ncbi:MAG: M20 family metallo-hydrolase [Pseudolysinimonas sp.]